jgi:hypothetical protein
MTIINPYYKTKLKLIKYIWSKYIICGLAGIVMFCTREKMEQWGDPNYQNREAYTTQTCKISWSGSNHLDKYGLVPYSNSSKYRYQ